MSGKADWTAERLMQLRALWAEGLAMSEIGRRFGVTKGVIAGKVHRLELPARPSPIGVRRAEGLAMSEIGRRFGVTKNVIAGKVHRLELPARPSPIGVRRAEGSRPPGHHRVPTQGLMVSPGGAGVIGGTLAALGLGLPDRVAPRPVIAAPPARPVAVMPVLTRRPCCWPMWGDRERPTHRYCGVPGVPGKSYCAEHGALAWVRLEPRSPAQIEADTQRRLKAMIANQRRAAG